MYRLKYNKVIFLVNISLHEYSSSFVFTQNLKNTLETTKWAFEATLVTDLYKKRRV
jgi:hypothetical protein